MSDIRKRSGKKGTTYQVRYPDGTSARGYGYATFKTRKEALAFRDDSRSRTVATSKSTEVRTVADGLQRWLDVCEKEGRDGRDPVTAATKKHYEWRAEHIKSYEWTKELHELTAPDIIEFRSWLVTTFSRNVAAKLLLSFHSMVLELVRRGILTHDIVAGVTIRGSRYTEPVSIPTVKEVTQLLAAADRLANYKNKQTQKTWERYRAMLYLAVDSGMPPQEYIVVPDYNIEPKGVKVDRALETGGQKISVTKTPAGRRFIELSPDTVRMVQHYASHSASRNQYKLVFPTSTGKWQTTDNWRKKGFYSACEAAGLMETVNQDGEFVERPKYKPYDLRHFFASVLIEQRVNLKRMQKLMGHESIETTLSVYGHLIEEAETSSEKHPGMLAPLSGK
jgi:integrase